MNTRSFARAASLVLASFCTLSIASCGGGGGSRAPASTVPDFQAAKFSAPTTITNPHLPLEVGTTTLLVAQNNSDPETLVVDVQAATRSVSGVLCRVVRERVHEQGLLVEDTRHWYAQDDAGNVWNLGEEVDGYDYDEDGNLLGVDHDGSWEAGKDVAARGVIARPGFAMPANPQPGLRYQREFYPGVAEDLAEVVGVQVPITLQSGAVVSCTKTRDTSALDAGVVDFKYYAPGLGVVLEETEGQPEKVHFLARLRPGAGAVPDFGAAVFSAASTIDHEFLPFVPGRAMVHVNREADEAEAIVVERLDGTRTVMGLACAIVQDRVFRGGLLTEDTRDWYAQDDAGNVWYMGEEVDNYEYDDDGNLLGVDHDGSWEAGLDIAGVGSLARPGFAMKAAPAAGDFYHQEFYDGEAEDMGAVVATGVSFETADERVYEDCVQILDWNPLDPDGIEFKFYAPGVGLVGEEALHKDQTVELAGTFAVDATSIPTFTASSFSNSTWITNANQPWPGGATWSYEKQIEQGLESIEIEVLSAPRLVMGIQCVVVRDRVYRNGLLREDTHDWYAQDDAGNVWYMGEEVDNYEYDEQGNLLGINHDGSWEAGLDVAGVGHIAQPGYWMLAAPTIGRSYYQEFYETAAEDMGLVVGVGVEVDLGNGTVYEHCLAVLDWNPLHPDSLEYKFFAPGIGLVMEQDLLDGEVTRLVSTSLQ